MSCSKLNYEAGHERHVSIAKEKLNCLILNKVDTKSLKKYGETTPRRPLCEGFKSH